MHGIFMNKKKYEVSVAVNSVNGYQVYGIEAESRKDALGNYHNGEIIREEYEFDWDRAYGDQPEPIIEEVDEFDYDYHKILENKLNNLNRFIGVILTNGVESKELRDFFIVEWNKIK